MAFRGGKLHTHGISDNNNENIGVSTSREPNYDEEQEICHVGSVKLVCSIVPGYLYCQGTQSVSRLKSYQTYMTFLEP